MSYFEEFYNLLLTSTLTKLQMQKCTVTQKKIFLFFLKYFIFFPSVVAATGIHTYTSHHSDLYLSDYTFPTLIKDPYRHREFPYFVLLIPNILNLFFHRLFIYPVLAWPLHRENRLRGELARICQI